MKSLACTHACPSPPLSRHSGLTDLALERAELVPRCRDLRLHRLNFEWAWKPSVRLFFVSCRSFLEGTRKLGTVEMFGKKPICTAYPADMRSRLECRISKCRISIQSTSVPRSNNFEMPNLDSINFCTTVKP
jgi:hypothetical protein